MYVKRLHLDGTPKANLKMLPVHQDNLTSPSLLHSRVCVSRSEEEAVLSTLSVRNTLVDTVSPPPSSLVDHA